MEITTAGSDLAGGLVPSDAKMPSEIIRRQLGTFESQIKQAQESAASQFAQAAEQMETSHIQSAETFALEEHMTRMRKQD